VWTDHDQLECGGVRHAVGEQILGSVDLELVDEDSAEFATFLLSDGRISGDSPDLLVQNLLLLFPESPDPLLECA